MNILFVSGHPAQVHNFRNAREELIKRGHTVYWLTTNKDIATNLLEIYKIPYTVLLKPKKNFFSRLFVLIRNVCFVFSFLKKNKIEIAVSRTCPYTSIAAFLAFKKHIIIDDTEHGAKMCKPFSNLVSTVIVPECFYYNIRKDQIAFAGNVELFYTHPNRFTPSSPYSLLGIEEGQKYAIVRFVKWDAYHDEKLVGGFSLDQKVRLVSILSKYVSVFISSEADLPEALEKYRICIPLEKMHDVLAYAEMIIGESATMASESVILGTPAIYIDQVGRGYTDEEAREGLLYMFRPNEQEEAIRQAEQLVMPSFDRVAFDSRRKDFIGRKIDPTAWLVWFIENYPQSVGIMREDPNYQFRFR